MNSNLKFFYLDSSCSDEIIELRRKSFARQYKNLFKPDAMIWNTTDRSSLHLGIKDQGKLVSALRLSFFNVTSKFCDATLISLPEGFSKPYSLPSRAATDCNYLNIGLHSRLRCHALEICLSFKFHSVFGSIETSAARFRKLLELGYEVVGAAKKWESKFLSSQEEVALLYLGGEDKIKNAVASLRETHGFEKMTQFPDKPVFV